MQTATAPSTQPKSLRGSESHVAEGRHSSLWHQVPLTLAVTSVGLALIAVGLAVAG